jgi:hypothetical protein
VWGASESESESLEFRGTHMPKQCHNLSRRDLAARPDSNQIRMASEAPKSLPASIPLLVRAARAILSPVYMWDLTTELLGVIAQIELWHQAVISRAEAALTVNANLIQYPYHRDGSSRGKCLSGSGRRYLEQITSLESVARSRKKYFMCSTALRREARI